MYVTYAFVFLLTSSDLYFTVTNINRLGALTDMFYIAEAIIRKNTMTW